MAKVTTNAVVTGFESVTSKQVTEALGNKPDVVTESGNVTGFRDPVTGQFIAAVPVYTWETKPLPTVFQGRAYISDIFGGVYYISNGTRWYPEGHHLVAKNIRNAVSHVANASEFAMDKTLFRKGMIKPGDILRFFISLDKSGASESANQRFRIGKDGLLTDTQFQAPVPILSGTTRSSGLQLEYKCVSNTQLRKLGNSNVLGAYNGSSTNPMATAVTVPDMDADDFYIQFTNLPVGVSETYTLAGYSIELITNPGT